MEEKNEYSEYNSSFDYLKRIGNLIWSAHTCSMDSKTKKDELLILEQLHIELHPEMTTEKSKDAEEKRKDAQKLTSSAIREYFIFLNDFAHSQGLILKKVQKRPGVLKDE